MKGLKRFLPSDVFGALLTAWRYAVGRGALQRREVPPAPEVRGDIALRRKTSGEDLCVGCKICVKICPADALSVQTEKIEGTWRVTEFRADMARCIYCGLCSEACPTGALIHTLHQAPPAGPAEAVCGKDELERKAEGREPEEKNDFGH